MPHNDRQAAIDAQIQSSPAYLKSMAGELDARGADPNEAYSYQSAGRSESHRLGSSHGFSSSEVDGMTRNAYNAGSKDFYE